jgi:aspartyl-tRNA(Asn)/glutamyl-tRNA(Gln) amidotransferase subunit B
MLDRIADNTLSGKLAKTVFESLWAKEGTTDEIIAQKGLTQITDEAAIEKIIDNVLASNEEQVVQYKAGKDKVFGFLIGQIMKETKGKANPQQVNDLLKKKLAL